MKNIFFDMVVSVVIGLLLNVVIVFLVTIQSNSGVIMWDIISNNYWGYILTWFGMSFVVLIFIWSIKPKLSI